jgi:ADP-heptose:LPS heptosyltransferase
LGLQLTQLVSLIKKCHLFIGNSTGPMHIAAAIGVPVVAIFGNIHPLDSYLEWGPWGEGHIVVSKNLNCPDCHPGNCRAFSCMELITAEEVFAAAKKQIKKYASR